jgi:hypothetical protein
MNQNQNESKPQDVEEPRNEGLDETHRSAKCPKCDLSHYVDNTGKCHRCGTKGITRQVTTFAEWYESKVGVTLEHAKRAGVYDLALLEDAFNFLPKA